MAKFTYTTLAGSSLATIISAINNNFAAAQTAFETSLFRDGSTPNTMSADLDMNSNDLINLTIALTDTEPVRLKELNLLDARVVIIETNLSTIVASVSAAASSAAAALASQIAAAASAVTAAASAASTGTFGSLTDVTITSVVSGELIKWSGSAWINQTLAELNLAVGVDLQAYDAGLADIAGLVVTDSNIIVGDGSNWVAESGSTARTSLGLGTGDSPTFTGLTLTSLFNLTGTADIIHTASEADDHTLELAVDAAGFGDVKALEIQYDTGTLASTEDEAIILINIDEVDAGGGDIIAFDVVATAGGADAIWALKAGVGINPLRQQAGTFGAPDAWNNDGVDELVEISTTGSPYSSVFVANSDFVIISKNAAFSEIEIELQTAAGNPGIRPTFEYGDDAGTSFAAFTPIDGTDGFRFSGVIDWDLEDIPSWVARAGGQFEIRIIRTANPSVQPVEVDIAQVSVVTDYEWDKLGNLTIGPSILQEESSAAIADVPGYGQWWVKDDAPNVPKFTDDGGGDWSFATLENLASTSNTLGASLVGIEDAGTLITATNVEGALAENRAAIDALEAGSSYSWKRTVFTSSGTYTKDAGLVSVHIRVQAPGGGGGGADGEGVDPTVGCAAGAGGGGEYGEGIYADGDIGSTETVTIGADGTAGSDTGGNGGTGGTTSVGSVITAVGGSGGVGTGSNDTSSAPNDGGVGGTGGSGGDFYMAGEDGQSSATPAPTGGLQWWIGKGGDGFLGHGGAGIRQEGDFGSQPADGAGNPGKDYGGGGSGTFENDITGSVGKVGGGGIVLIDELIAV